MINFLLAAEEPNGVFIPGDVNEFYWGSAAFIIVVGLLVWKAGPAIKKLFADRTARIEAELDDASQARIAAEAELADVTSALGDIDTASQEVLTEARGTAERLKADLVAKADADAAELRSRTEAELATATSHASSDLQNTASAMALEAAEAVVGKNLDDETHAELIDSYIDQVGAA